MTSDLLTLLSTSVPSPFIYLHHPHHPPSTVLQDSLPTSCLVARVDTIEHYNSRLFFSGILQRLKKGTSIELGEVASWDGFARGLKQIWASRHGEMIRNGTTKGKGKRKIDRDLDDEMRVLIVVTKAERLRHVLGGGWSVLTRLAEMSGIPATLVLASQMPWEEIRPPRGDALEPIHVYLPPLSREETIKQLLPGSPHPLYPRFLDLLLTTIQPLLPSSPPLELEYISEALWPIYTSNLPEHAEQILLNKPYTNPLNPPPPLSITVKLLTELKHQSSLAFTSAIENILPRTTGRHEFVIAMMPFDGSGGFRQGIRAVPKLPGLELPICAKYLIIAAYCASYNPAKSDMRLFGRGVGSDGKRRRGGGTRRAGYGRTRIGKVPQRLLGPKPFPLDRLLAIFASLFAEHAERPEDLQASIGHDQSSDESDYENELIDRGANGEKWLPSIAELSAKATKRRKREIERDERWEDEVEHLTMSVKLWSLIPDLEGQDLLRRISPPERLDNVMLRCDVDYDNVKTLARELRITLDEYLYEAVM